MVTKYVDPQTIGAKAVTSRSRGDAPFVIIPALATGWAVFII
ncbi:hypothetical protein OHC50_04400 [Paenarthrobacter ilicis]|nr:hypothetical protein [Paenarthrobacter ilicis]